jgi:hypothetical protein
MNDSSSHPDPLDELFDRAKRRRCDTDRAEYGFETRLLARLRARREETPVWSAVSWRMAPLFAAAVLALSLWAVQADLTTRNAEQEAYMQNPDAGDLLSTF